MIDGDRETRVTAAEPVAHDPGDRAVANDSQPHGRAPRDDAQDENRIDEATAGDGVTFFEGGDGREDARTDIERSG